MSSSELSDVESELTDLEETAPTPGRAPSAEDDSGIHMPNAIETNAPAQAQASSSRAPQRASGRRKSLRGAASTAEDVDAQPQEQQAPQDAMSPQADAPTASMSKRRIKVKSRDQSRAASPAAEDAQQGGGHTASSMPKKGLKIKLSRDRAKGQQSGDMAPSDVPPSAAQAGSSSFRDALKDLGDSEDDEDEEAVRSTKRGTRRPRASNVAAADDEAVEGAGDTSQQKLKKRKPEGAKQRAGSAPKKARRIKGESDEDAQLESDSDEEMQDVASSEGEYEEGASKRKAGKSSAGKSKAGNVKAAKPSDGAAKGKGSAASTKSKGAAGKKGQQGSEGDSKSTVGKIRASAAVTAAAASAAASSSSSPSQTVDSPLGGATAGGPSSLSSPLPPISRKAPLPPGATAAPRRPMPMPMKPRGSDMWDSLVGSSKPRPPPVAPRPPPGAQQQQKKDGANAGPRPPRPPPPSAPPGLPRPLGTAPTPMGPAGSSIARPRTSQHLYPGSSSTSRDAYATSNGSFVVHMTPGLNGQHWDKAAYRQLRQSECYAYSNPEPESLFNLLEDAELVQQFEEEWKEIRYGSSAVAHRGGRRGENGEMADQQRAGAEAVEPLFDSCHFPNYGAGSRYADQLKEQGKVEASVRAAKVVAERRRAIAMGDGPAGHGSTHVEGKAR